MAFVLDAHSISYAADTGYLTTVELQKSWQCRRKWCVADFTIDTHSRLPVSTVNVMCEPASMALPGWVRLRRRRYFLLPLNGN